MPWWQEIALGVVCAVAAMAMRLLAAPLLMADAPFITFFVAVMAAAAWGGRIAGATASVASVAIAWAAQLTLHDPTVPPGRHIGAAVAFFLVSAALIAIAETLRGALRREAEANRQLTLVGYELQHRVKNQLAVVQGLARQTGRTVASVAEFQKALNDRLVALARAQSLVLDPGRLHADVGTVVEEVLSPFGFGDRLVLSPPQPDVAVDAGRVVALALLFNELATNALKHGALSSPEGRVNLSWARTDGRVTVIWREQDGPRVAGEPEAMGFGSTLFRTALSPSQGRVALTYAADGVVCRIELLAP